MLLGKAIKYPKQINWPVSIVDEKHFPVACLIPKECTNKNIVYSLMTQLS